MRGSHEPYDKGIRSDKPREQDIMHWVVTCEMELVRQKTMVKPLEVRPKKRSITRLDASTSMSLKRKCVSDFSA